MPQEQLTNGTIASVRADPCDKSVTASANVSSLRVSIEEQLEEICNLIKKGVQPPRQTVRSILGWLGASRRSFNVNACLEHHLNAYGLNIVPEFAFANVDDELSFVLEEDGGDDDRDASYRVGQLKAANAELAVVTLDATLEQAITLMMHGNYSQLPVMANNRDVKGIISWRSIGKRLALKIACNSVRECMETAQIISTDDSFFYALEIIAKHDYVLVKGADRKITGILTASDFNDQFRKMAEPFLLVGEIEKRIRGVLAGHFTGEELETAKAPWADSRKIDGVSDLTFGEYVRLLGTESAWKRVNLHVDRQKFVCWLDQVRNLRNNVMHFNPDGLEETDLVHLQKFADFLRCLNEAGAI